MEDCTEVLRFQSTLPQRERREQSRVYTRATKFQSTLPQRERPEQELLKADLENFNPRSRKGSDWYICRADISPALFQSTLPQRERLCSEYSAEIVLYFNPRSRKGSDERFATQNQRIPISIHAPAKGATKPKLRIRTTTKFQSTLPQRERRRDRRKLPRLLRFQSTLPQRERQQN